MSKDKYGCGGRLKKLSKAIAAWSVSKGWETNWWNVPEKLMLAVTELAEAMEEYRELGNLEIMRLEDERTGKIALGAYPLNYDCVRMEHCPKFRVEIADAVIRLLNLSASLGIDIETEIAAKMEINEKRPFKHGGKNC
jgi:NTP pyrophosphatase (non-canonical NTP hydrolase)